MRTVGTTSRARTVGAVTLACSGTTISRSRTVGAAAARTATAAVGCCSSRTCGRSVTVWISRWRTCGAAGSIGRGATVMVGGGGTTKSVVGTGVSVTCSGDSSVTCGTCTRICGISGVLGSRQRPQQVRARRPARRLPAPPPWMRRLPATLLLTMRLPQMPPLAERQMQLRLAQRPPPARLRHRPALRRPLLHRSGAPGPRRPVWCRPGPSAR